MHPLWSICLLVQRFPVGVASIVLTLPEKSRGADPSSVLKARGRMYPTPTPIPTLHSWTEHQKSRGQWDVEPGSFAPIHAEGTQTLRKSKQVPSGADWALAHGPG